MTTTKSDLWLPEGHHWDLHIEHSPKDAINAGAFTGGGWKIEVHITVSPWGATRQMVQVLKDKHAEAHFVIGGAVGLKHPLVVQLLPLDVAGRALQNDQSDGFQTNRANVIQVEICANPGRSIAEAVRDRDKQLERWGTDLFSLNDYMLVDRAMRNAGIRATSDDWKLCMTEPPEDTGGGFGSLDRVLAKAFNDGVASWTEQTYAALGNLFELIRHRVPVPNKVPRSFQNTQRFTDREYVEAEGYVGHMHTPDNTHIDPTPAFRGAVLVRKVRSAPNPL